MTFKYDRLKGRIVEKFGSQKEFANALDCSEATVTKKLNNVVAFDSQDIMKWSYLLDIEPSEIHLYFFVVDVQEIEH